MERERARASASVECVFWSVSQCVGRRVGVVCGARHGALSMDCGVWMCGVWCVECGVWCVVCGVWCVLCAV